MALKEVQLLNGYGSLVWVTFRHSELHGSSGVHYLLLDGEAVCVRIAMAFLSRRYDNYLGR